MPIRAKRPAPSPPGTGTSGCLPRLRRRVLEPEEDQPDEQANVPCRGRRPPQRDEGQKEVLATPRTRSGHSSSTVETSGGEARSDFQNGERAAKGCAWNRASTAAGSSGSRSGTTGGVVDA